MPSAAKLQLVRSALPEKLRGRVQSGRELHRQRRRSPREDQAERFATGLAPLDRLLGGGLARGELTEWVGRRSSGLGSLLLTTLGAVTGAGHTTALVDLGDGFSPAAMDGYGIEPRRLLWVRPQVVGEALAAAEALVTGGFPLVVLDLGPPPLAGGRGAEAAWVRLAKSVREHRPALLVIAPYRVSGAGASTVVETRPAEIAWSRRQAPGATLLQGLRTELTLVKRPGVAPGAWEEMWLHTGSPWAETCAASARTAPLATPASEPSRQVAFG
jgi:hypothetical protein